MLSRRGRDQQDSFLRWSLFFALIKLGDAIEAKVGVLIPHWLAQRMGVLGGVSTVVIFALMVSSLVGVTTGSLRYAVETGQGLTLIVGLAFSTAGGTLRAMKHAVEGLTYFVVLGAPIFLIAEGYYATLAFWGAFAIGAVSGTGVRLIVLRPPGWGPRHVGIGPATLYDLVPVVLRLGGLFLPESSRDAVVSMAIESIYADMRAGIPLAKLIWLIANEVLDMIVICIRERF